MRTRALPLFLLFLLFPGCSDKKPAAAPAGPPEVGGAAPDFSLVGSDGKTHTLSEMRGRPVVLAWFPKAFTGGCTAECKSLRESSESLRQYDAAYFAVSTDKAEDNKRFAESLDADYPILSDPNGDTARAYGVIGKDGVHAKRWTYYIDGEGKVLYIDREVKPATAGQDVVQRADALKIAKRAN